MFHYKIRIKAFDSRSELWIAITAKNIREAVLKAHERCATTRHIFYALEESIHEIDQEEYNAIMKKKAVP